MGSAATVDAIDHWFWYPHRVQSGPAAPEPADLKQADSKQADSKQADLSSCS